MIAEKKVQMQKSSEIIKTGLRLSKEKRELEFGCIKISGPDRNDDARNDHRDTKIVLRLKSLTNYKVMVQQHPNKCLSHHGINSPQLYFLYGRYLCDCCYRP